MWIGWRSAHCRDSNFTAKLLSKNPTLTLVKVSEQCQTMTSTPLRRMRFKSERPNLALKSKIVKDLE